LPTKTLRITYVCPPTKKSDPQPNLRMRFRSISDENHIAEMVPEAEIFQL
jgi:hypothetical protein